MSRVHISDFEFAISRNGGYILLVDDIADTGKTLKAAKEELERKTGRKIITATVAYKPQSVMKPDAYVYNVDNNTWIAAATSPTSLPCWMPLARKSLSYRDRMTCSCLHC